MELTRTYTKKGSTTTVSTRPMDDGKVEVTTQRWSSSGRRLIFNQSQWSAQGAKTVFINRCIELEKLGWARQEESV